MNQQYIPQETLLKIYKNMTTEQQNLLSNRISEFVIIGVEISELNIPKRWIETFTHLVYYRGWVKLDMLSKDQMDTIGLVNSESVLFLANQNKKAGLRTLYKLSIDIEDESIRKEAITLIMEKGIKQAEKELDIIISVAKSKSKRNPTLFD